MGGGISSHDPNGKAELGGKHAAEGFLHSQNICWYRVHKSCGSEAWGWDGGAPRGSHLQAVADSQHLGLAETVFGSQP